MIAFAGLILWDGCYVMARHIEMLERVKPGSIKGKRCVDP